MDNFRNRFANRPKEEIVERTIASYDQHAESFFKKHGDFEPIEALLEFQRFVLPGSRILDAGCGLGRDTDYLRKHVYPNSIGLDLSLGMLTVGCNEAGFHFPAVQGDFRKLPFAPQSFDGIWAVASIIHIPRSNVVNVLREFKRILKDGGYVYISIIKYMSMINKDKEEADPGDDDVDQRGWRYFVFYDQEEIESLLMQSGLKSLTSWERPGKMPRPSEKFKKRDWIHIIAKA